MSCYASTFEANFSKLQKPALTWRRAEGVRIFGHQPLALSPLLSRGQHPGRVPAGLLHLNATCAKTCEHTCLPLPFVAPLVAESLGEVVQASPRPPA